MKMKIIHSKPEALDRTTRYARTLLARSLERHYSRIRSITVEVNPGTDIHLGEFDYSCTVQIFTTQGHKITTEARDCDEILAVYRAVDKVRCQMEYPSRGQFGRKNGDLN